jgi:DNA polymerase II small subunit
MTESPEELRHVLQSIATQGFQLSKDAFEFLSAINHEELADSVREALRRAKEISPTPIVITREFFEPKPKTSLQSTVASSVGTLSAPARDIESRIEVVSDPARNPSTRGSLDSFVKYFQSRFEKMSMILRQRPDVRGARSIADALEAGPNENVKFIAMVMTKRERSGKIFLEVDDFENSATILVVGVQDNVYEIAQRLSLDQVVCFETVKGRNDLLVAKGICLPDIPERKPNKASEPVNVALVSDIHYGSKTFLESVFKQMILWLNRKVGSPQQMGLAGRTKYVIIAGDVVDGVGIYPQEV